MDMRSLLKSLMALRDENAYALEERSGVPQATINRFLTGKHGDPRSTTVRKWAGAYNLTESQLRGDAPLPDALMREIVRAAPEYADDLLPSPTGATSEHPARPDPTSETLPIPSDDDYALIPQYSARAACGPAYHNGHVEVRGGLAFKRDWLARMGLRPENLSVIAANGESMAPTIHDGEVLLIDHSDTEPQDGKVFALARGDEMVVKRLVRDFMGGWVVRSDNSDKARFGDFHVSDSAIRIVGRVVWRGGGL